MNDIKKYTEDLIMNPNFICTVNKELFINVRLEAINTFLNTVTSIIDIEDELYKKYGLMPLNDTRKDFLQYYYILIGDIINMNKEDIKKRFTDNEVEERMLFRIELYKEGWSVEKIEKYIYKYLLKIDREIIAPYIEEIYYHNLMYILKVVRKDRERIKGRPSLPPLLKERVKNKHLNKIRDNMRIVYKKQNLFDEIRGSLLNTEEIKTVETIINDEVILNKIRNLYIREI